jgi:hypothetical protein
VQNRRCQNRRKIDGAKIDGACYRYFELPFSLGGPYQPPKRNACGIKQSEFNSAACKIPEVSTVAFQYAEPPNLPQNGRDNAASLLANGAQPTGARTYYSASDNPG